MSKKPLGYASVACDTVKTLANAVVNGVTGIPTGATMAYLMPEAQAMRYTDDGNTTPTATVGFPVPTTINQPVLCVGDLTKVQFIGQTAGCKVNVLFYKN